MESEMGVKVKKLWGGRVRKKQQKVFSIRAMNSLQFCMIFLTFFLQIESMEGLLSYTYRQMDQVYAYSSHFLEYPYKGRGEDQSGAAAEFIRGDSYQPRRKVNESRVVENVGISPHAGRAGPEQSDSGRASSASQTTGRGGTFFTDTNKTK